MPAPELDELLVADAAAFRAWLAEHGTTSPGVWLVLTKKGGTVTALGYEDAVDEAICQGWIDGQLRPRDAQTMCIRFTPRRPRSVWSAKNVRRVERLEGEGRMQPAGRAQVEAAQANGRWDSAYGGSATIEPPQDLLDAVAADPRAQAWWDVLSQANRFAICYRLLEAKRQETRERRLAAFVADLAEGRTPHPQKARPADL